MFAGLSSLPGLDSNQKPSGEQPTRWGCAHVANAWLSHVRSRWVSWLGGAGTKLGRKLSGQDTSRMAMTRNPAERRGSRRALRRSLAGIFPLSREMRMERGTCASRENAASAS